MLDTRPDPDALLAEAQREDGPRARGRLKIFFGMCPGVGKTYTMLEAARQRALEGVDVVAGYVEPHARPDTESLLLGLDVLARKRIEYRGVTLEEFDLDGALQRRPQLILVDELAHSNAPGARHAKRSQDVEELLDAGIDVYTTLNVQHLESLNNVIAQITGVVVRETVPDSLLDRADEIELVDLPPDELLDRLAEGRVYVADQAREAATRFFRRENLIALRELALRVTAERVNAQVQAQHAGRGVARPWATSDRLLVCVGPSPLSARVIRTARRVAASQRVPWIAVSVETPDLSRRAADGLERNMRLAERLGAETAELSGTHVADEVLEYARRRNITRIIVGKPTLPRWREWLRGSVVDELVRRSGEIDIHVVKGEADQSEPSEPASDRSSSDVRAYAATIGVMVLCTAAGYLCFPFLSPVNLTMIYLAGVVFTATRYPAGPAALASVLAALLFDFLFTEPYYSFAISDTEYLIAFVVLLTTALLISGLAQRVRRQSAAARTRYLRTIALYFMSRQLAAASTRGKLAEIAERNVADVFSGDAIVLTPGPDGNLTSNRAAPDWLGANERAAAHWVFHQGKWAGRGTETLAGASAIYVPLAASGRPLGVLGLKQRQSGTLEPDQRHMLETFATQLAIALERAAFAEEAAAARVAAETEQTRNALLSCVSHDLRTPLAAIGGSAAALTDPAVRLSNEQQVSLLTSITEESERMNELVGKLLDMTRLETPGFRLERDWYPVQDLVGAALTRLEARLARHTVETDLPHELAVQADGVLVEQVLTNLLENAAKHTPAGSIIRIAARADGADARVEVSDNGPGLPAGSEQSIFEKFVRERPGHDRSGVGLGLAICRAIVRLHGGRIGAVDRPGGGACFWFTLPRDDTPTAARASRAHDGAAAGAAP